MASIITRCGCCRMWGAMGFNWCGRRYVFSFTFFALIAAYMLLDRYGVGLPCLAAIALHESGHIAAMWACGAKIDEICFLPFGVRIEKRGLLSYRAEMLVYAGGISVNALTACVTFLLCGTNLFMWINLLLCGFNLLPVGRLDGGVLLRLALCRVLLPDRAEQVQRMVSFAMLAVLLIAALWLARLGNFTLLLTTAYLATQLCTKG